MTPRRLGFTWSDLRREWDSMSQVEREGLLSMAANCRPDFEFATGLAVYAVSPEHAREMGAPEEAIELLGEGTGFEEIRFDQPNRLGRAAAIAWHPTLGWFVFNPKANPNTDSSIIYDEGGDDALLALACVSVLLPCCGAMRDQLHYECDTHGNDCPDRVVRFSTVPEPHGRWLLVSQNAEWDFEFCPWCGQRFQNSIGEPGHRRLRMPPTAANG